MEVAFVHNGGSCSLRGDIQLSSPDAPRRVLAYTADLMERRRCWVGFRKSSLTKSANGVRPSRIYVWPSFVFCGAWQTMGASRHQRVPLTQRHVESGSSEAARCNGMGVARS